MSRQDSAHAAWVLAQARKRLMEVARELAASDDEAGQRAAQAMREAEEKVERAARALAAW